MMYHAALPLSYHIVVHLLGSFCESNSGTPTPCPNGTYTEIEGAPTENDCKTCPAGYFCLEGTEYPDACEPGMFVRQPV